ncbi:hypothetical protein QBC35DRAFT_453970 [Podospora australis]|uniref:SRR1-like domain-containing protein n=1 Tax=Podospora australis TaxID=1536484 RepID=A0AAN7AFW2_9PEZI|nr:hypothetical protein QBC35DRAFT_453970 [Podospora australis]
MADSQSGGEWNQVKRKGRRIRNVVQSTSQDNDAPSALQPNPNPEHSVTDLVGYHEKVSKKFKESSCWENIEKLFSFVLSNHEKPVITKAVCLGTGPYDPYDGSAQARWTAHMQTAAFNAVVELIREKTGQEIKCFIQEPRFTQFDKDFCAKLGLDAVDSPTGFDLVDKNTLLFGIHLEIEICNLALKALPVVLIGTGLEEWLKVHPRASKEEPGSLHRFFDVEDTHTQYTFPDLDFIFSSTSMYWRKDEQNPVNTPVIPEKDASTDQEAGSSPDITVLLRPLDTLRLTNSGNSDTQR